jgi:aerobic-type carbon monoxide dehydrogenase small subunit (CoxS/CutS family)
VSDTSLPEVGRAGTGLPTVSDPPSVGAPAPEPPWAHALLPIERQDASVHGASRGGWSRRDFIKGIIASGVTVSGLSYFGAGCTPSLPAQTAAGFERLISMNVNGQLRRVDVLPSETLAMTLRYKLGLTGTKLGCDRAECGACTVLIDDVSHYACSTLTHRVRDREVTTVEGLEGPNGELHPVQQAFVDELGPQCGFCTPGQVMSAVALLRRNANPTREEARQAMAGNLCRCGAYHHYLNGVMRAASMREA